MKLSFEMYCIYLFISLFTISISMVECNSAPPINPFTADIGLSAMHDDTASSDTTPYSGPGSGEINAISIALLSVCPTVVQGNDGYIIALCTCIATQGPVVYMLTTNGTLLASLTLVKGGLFGGVYAYLDNLDNLVVTDGNNNINRVAHTQDSLGIWQLEIIESISIQSELPTADDYIVGLSPDWYGNIWFASAAAVVGYANLETNLTQSISLPAGESVANSISTVLEGTFVATDHALYLISANDDPKAIPTIQWRYAYNRGPGRKPGELSWGTGSTPTIFGPNNGTEYVTIADNAVPINVLIFEVLTGRLLCQHPIFAVSASGSENSPIGSGNSVFFTSTYGYPYLALPPNAGNSTPASAKFIGGVVRVDYNATSSTCSTVWTNSNFKNAVVAKLSLSDNLIYTMSRINPLLPNADASVLDSYYFATMDPNTGNVISTEFTGTGSLYDTQQMAPLISREGHFFQGIVNGINHIWQSD